MAGIAGIARSGSGNKVSEMLDAIGHRGKERKIFEVNGTTMGVVYNETGHTTLSEIATGDGVYDVGGPGHYTGVRADNGRFSFTRDELGVAPLYSGHDRGGIEYFASEVKALSPFTVDIHEISPGQGWQQASTGKSQDDTVLLNYSPDPARIAENLRSILDKAVSACIATDETGSWLSGGLDSATICALAARRLPKLRTFAAGLRGAPDLEYAAETARHIGASHHEITVTVDEMVKALPDVIYHLESFDALLVRSSILNFMVAAKASDYVSEVFSGEGGDELFGGYDYLKDIPLSSLQDELRRITGKLHNTALQRVDRCSSAHGTEALVAFADPQVYKYAFTIPAEYKIMKGIEKWILRKAAEDLLPEKVLWRSKAKFWDGAGVRERLADVADRNITDNDFTSERVLPNGWELNSKEELYYYRIFREHFGDNTDLSWMGRSDIVPPSA
jgi:asparagine synthase (glutamine-hydrolysing)